MEAITSDLKVQFKAGIWKKGAICQWPISQTDYGYYKEFSL